MASVHVSQSGSGDLSGTDRYNTIPLASMTATEWNLPAKSSDGAERLYFHGEFTARIQLGGAGGTDDINRLWLDTTNASNNVADVYFLSTNSKSYVNVVLGVHYATSSNTNGIVYIFRPANSVTVMGGTLINEDLIDAALRVWVDTYDVNDVVIDGLTVNQTGSTRNDAILWAVSGGGTDTGKFVNPTVINCYLSGGKILFNYSDPDTQIGTNNRRATGALIANNTIEDTPANAIQCAFFDGGLIRLNRMRRIGYQSTLTNAIQTNYNLNTIIEYNDIDTVLNGTGATGDGNGIIIDWSADLGRPYSDGVIVRGNFIRGCRSVTNCAGISLWASTNGETYGNVCVDNNNGISISDATSIRSWTTTGITSGADTTFNYTQADNTEVFVGDTVVITGTSGLTPDVDGTHTVKTASAGTFTIELSTTGTWNSDGGIQRVHRGFNNTISNNTCENNVQSGVLTKAGGQSFANNGNIMIGSQYGYYNTDTNGAVLSTDADCVFYDQSSTSIQDGASPGTPDASSVETTTNPVDNNYELIEGHEVVGIVSKWWTGPNPVGRNTEPFSDVNTDPGANQSTFSKIHPVNL